MKQFCLLNLAFATYLLVAGTYAAFAQEDIVSQPKALNQCGACHMIFPAQMLPQRSWIKILSELDHHFGESASLPDRDAAAIRDYLISHAADAPNATARERHYNSGLLPDSTPIRITDTPWWNQMHADFDISGVSRSTIKSMANCLGCHTQGVK